ncbi:hypothetical protein V8B55DRAFT_1485754 [Mucor lusitanicus]|uniref:Uncharacterized protein n=1 Tax=Mucor circinelloides f. lusitanicus TaxID=29924 RepID=A0A8H4EWL6_MUCCL|nr:hypothetical protein FB192DRAFT_1402186 [Mucor lusitanicus]
MRAAFVFIIMILTFTMSCFQSVSATKEQAYSQRTALRKIKRQNSGSPGSQMNGGGGMSSGSESSGSATMQTGPGP